MVQMKLTKKACNFYTNKMDISRNQHAILDQLCYIFLLLNFSHFSQNLFNKIALMSSGYHQQKANKIKYKYKREWKLCVHWKMPKSLDHIARRFSCRRLPTWNWIMQKISRFIEPSQGKPKKFLLAVCKHPYWLKNEKSMKMRAE